MHKFLGHLILSSFFPSNLGSLQPLIDFPSSSFPCPLLPFSFPHLSLPSPSIFDLLTYCAASLGHELMIFDLGLPSARLMGVRYHACQVW